MATCNGIYDMYQHRKPESEIHQTFREVAPDDKDGMYDNRTPLHLACHFADGEAVRILLERGAEVNEKDGREHTPLATLAVTSFARPDDEERRASIAALLLENGARVSRSAPDTTALLMAVENRHFKMASVIVDSGCRIDQTNSYDENVLHIICRISNVNRELRQAEDNLKKTQEDTFFSDEVRARKAAECETSVVYYRDVEKDSLDLVRRLLASGQIDSDDKTGNGETAWDIAIENKAMKIAALLSGSDPETDELAARHGNMDLFQAMWKRNTDALNALLDSGVELQTVCEHKEMYDFYGKSPLACALTWFYDFPEFAELLLKAGADPNFRFADESTAFEIGTKVNLCSSKTERYTALLKQMTECGWDIEMSADKEGNSALAVACRYSGCNWGNAAIPHLLKSGASVNAVNRFGQTPLMLLYGGRAWDGRSPYKPYDSRVDGNEEAKFLEMLLEAGADTGKKDIWGNTLLHYIAASCCDTGAKNTMELLADFGVPNVNEVNNEGLTALDIATEKDNEAMVKFLLKYA